MASKFSLPPLSPSKDPADYPYFKGGISRLVWRIYTQRLTPAGRWFAIATAIFGAYGGATLQLQGYVIATYAGALWLVALVAMVMYRPRVDLKARLAPRVCAGQTLPVDVTIEQLSPLRGADLIVLPHRLPIGIEAVPDHGLPLRDLAQSERAIARVGLKCEQRGAYTLRGFRVETHFPFNLLRTRRTFIQDHPLLVYPRFAPLSRLNLPTGRRYQPGGVALASELGESFEYLGNREFREGDSVRDIDWRATARMQRPIVREWVEEFMLRVAVVLDTHIPEDPAKTTRLNRVLAVLNPEPRIPDPAFERAVSISASVSDYMARQDYLVDIFAAGPNLYHLTAGRSLAYLDQILDILAVVDSTEQEPFATIEPQIGEILSRISTVICVFLDYNATRQAFIERMLQQGVAVKVIIVRDGKCTLDPTQAPDGVGQIVTVDAEMFAKGVDEL
ncbi:MAG TPA: DUF58 domain-containing protein [Tepidisphaeraceae bacterium]|jgi:uncharacterized protein (DUF58 family)